MADFDNSIALAAEQIAASIPDEGFEAAAEPVAEATPETPALEPTESPATSADDVGEELADEAQAQSEADTVQETAPAIEPPPGLTDDERSAWETLPPDAQKIIARRERDRTAELRRGQDEIANQKKAIEQERLRHAQAADTFTSLASTIDPIIAEGQKTDWTKLASENPAEYVQKRAVFDQRVQYLQAAYTQAEQIRAQQTREMLVKEEQALVAKIPEWADRSKAEAGVNDLRKGVVTHYGFKPEEAAALSDHRIALMARDALAYRADQAAKAKAKVTAPDKRVVVAPKVVRPGAAKDTDSVGGGVKAISKQLASTSDLRDRAALIASIL